MTPASRRQPLSPGPAREGTHGLERLRRRIGAGTPGEETELFARIAAAVAERRRAWDLSQRELAELCGTTQSAIARIERGRRPPRIDTLKRIADALDCELSVELKPRTKEEKA